MQVELLDRQKWKTKVEPALAIADYIEGFYNPARPHSSLGFLSHSMIFPLAMSSVAPVIHDDESEAKNQAGPPNGVKPTRQPQRDSNPCLHLERVVSLATRRWGPGARVSGLRSSEGALELLPDSSIYIRRVRKSPGEGLIPSGKEFTR
jgi:hypothetical protein